MCAQAVDDAFDRSAAKEAMRRGRPAGVRRSTGEEAARNLDAERPALMRFLRRRGAAVADAEDVASAAIFATWSAVVRGAFRLPVDAIERSKVVFAYLRRTASRLHHRDRRPQSADLFSRFARVDAEDVAEVGHAYTIDAALEIASLVGAAPVNLRPALLQVLRCGNVQAAARELGQPPRTLRRRLRALGARRRRAS